jgi:hypothetical protein
MPDDLWSHLMTCFGLNWQRRSHCKFGKNCKWVDSHTKTAKKAAKASRKESPKRSTRKDKGGRDNSPSCSPSHSHSRSRSCSPTRTLLVARLQGAFDAFCNKKQGLKAGECISNLAMKQGCRVRNCTLTGCRPNSRQHMLAPHHALIDFFCDTQVGGGVGNAA